MYNAILNYFAYLIKLEEWRKTGIDVLADLRSGDEIVFVVESLKDDKLCLRNPDTNKLVTFKLDNSPYAKRIKHEYF